jgi:xanthine dehydrogenase accessory factor
MRPLTFWREVAARLEAGQRAAITLVVDNSPHSPGTRGARMAVWEDGQRVGTIGGGAMELKQLESSRALLASGAHPPPTLQLLVHRSSGPGERSGMICAGQQTNLTVVLEAGRHLDALRAAVAIMEADEPGWLVLDHTGALEARAAEAHAPSALYENGASWRYEEALLETRRAVIFGAGHCGLALARQLWWLDYVVTVADSRAGLDTLAQIQEGGFARHVVLEEALEDTAARVRWPALCAAVVMTVSYPQDVAALTGALKQPFPFIGVMGAPAKLVRIKAALGERGFGAQDLARITAPVGLPIQSQTPEEIAVSVAAQLLSNRRSLNNV